MDRQEPVEVTDMGRVRRLIRYLNTTESISDLCRFVMEFHGFHLPLSSFTDDDNRFHHLIVMVGVGNFGGSVYMHGKCGGYDIKGVSLGMIEDTPYMVIFVPGEGFYLAVHPEDPTPAMEQIPYKFTRVIPGVHEWRFPADFQEYETYDDVELIQED
jgi:hypothetical protein